MKKFLLALLLASALAIPVHAAAVAPVFSQIGKLTGANFNTTADQSITLTQPTAGKPWCIYGFIVTNPSVSLTTAAGSFYAGAAKTNIIITTSASSSVWTGLTTSSDIVGATTIFAKLVQPFSARLLYVRDDNNDHLSIAWYGARRGCDGRCIYLRLYSQLKRDLLAQ